MKLEQEDSDIDNDPAVQNKQQNKITPIRSSSRESPVFISTAVMEPDNMRALALEEQLTGLTMHVSPESSSSTLEPPFLLVSSSGPAADYQVSVQLTPGRREMTGGGGGGHSGFTGATRDVPLRNGST